MTGEPIAPAPVVPEAEYWNQIAGALDVDGDSLWRVHADAVNVALCRRWLPRAGLRRVLKTDAFDEAVGRGLWRMLSGLAGRVDTIDHAWQMAARARRRQGGMPVTAADVRALPFADGAFDAVVSNSTLDHFEASGDIATSLAELHRVMAAGGRLVLTLDNAANPAVWLRNALPFAWVARAGLVPYFVGATLGPRALSEMTTRAGFRVKEVTAVMHCPRVAAVPLARLVARGAGPGRGALLRLLGACEAARRWPSRFLTGHYVAVLAEKA